VHQAGSGINDSIWMSLIVPSRCTPPTLVGSNGQSWYCKRQAAAGSQSTITIYTGSAHTCNELHWLQMCVSLNTMFVQVKYEQTGDHVCEI